MNQPTIKEKIVKIIDKETTKLSSEINKPYISDDTNREFAVRIGVFTSSLMYELARLICEEMTGELKYPTVTDARIGYKIRVAEEEQKAQEILKVLE